MRGLFIAIAALVAGFQAQASLVYTPPPQPPAGWEKEVTTGFDPSVESFVLRDPKKVDNAKDAAQLKAWNPERATPVLIKLYNDARWKPWQGRIAHLLCLADTPAAGAFFIDRIKPLLHPTTSNLTGEWNLLLNECPSSAQEELETLLEKRLQEAAAAAELPESQESVLNSICFHLLFRIKTPEAITTVTRCTEAGPETLRWAAISSLHSDDDKTYALVTGFAAKAQSPRFKKRAEDLAARIQAIQEDRRAQERAQQPMTPLSKHHTTAKKDTVPPTVGPSTTLSIKAILTKVQDKKEDLNGRRWALAALGQMGTKKSVSAWKKLRDAAYSKPGAPQKKTSYTHAERIIETAIMVLYIIPGAPDESAQSTEGPRLKFDPKDVRVFADGETAELSISIGYDCNTRANLKFRRVGDEWMATEVSPPITVCI